ncbi:amyloid fiber anchoring/assembly protein TapA [Oceanobacillus profundus]|nr:amyloid fiber anchoring/assembly protein TapA [Oceanobacillus profundus]
MSRLNKFKQKNQLLFLLLKVSLIWYVLLFSINYVTSDTAAHFTNSKETSGDVTIGTWEDPDSYLRFTSKGNDNIKACKAVKISTDIKNTGPGDMKESSSYHVYYIENGNPEKHGKKLKLGKGEGVIPPLDKGKSTKLNFQASSPGVYVFTTKEIAGDSSSKTIWSKWIKINCPSSKTADKEENPLDKSTENTEEKESKPQTNETKDNGVKQVESESTVEETESTEEKKEDKSKEDKDKEEKVIEEEVETEVEEVKEEANASVKSKEQNLKEAENKEEITNEQEGEKE